MGENTTHGLVYFLKIDKAYQEHLGNFRHWDNLKWGQDDAFVWLKDFTEAQIHSLAIQQLPFKELFYVQNQQLFPFGKKLPIGKAPSFLWTPIERAISVELPPTNENELPTLEEKVMVNIVPSEIEKQGIALLTELKHLQQYIETAPAIRLKKLSWLMIDHSKALVLGTPLLPLPGQVFWADNKFLLPLGYHFELPILSQYINKKVNPDYENWILWDKTGSYSVIPQEQIQRLSISSVRLSL